MHDSRIANINIIDISHEITPFHLPECAYIVKSAYKHFPKNSVHIIAVDTEKQKNTRHIAAYIDEHYFIASDSGVLSLIFPKIKATEIVNINISGEYETELFPAKDIFVKVACHILRGGKLNVIGDKIDFFKSFMNPVPVETNEGKSLIGEVIYIDRFGNSVIEPPKTPKDILYTVTPESVRLLIAAASGLRDKAIISLHADSGVRRSELANIQVEDIDLERHRITV